MNDPYSGVPASSSSLLGTLKSFFTGIGKIFSILGKVVKAIFILFILVGVLAWISVLANWTQGERVRIADSGAMRIELNGPLVDELTYSDPFSLLVSNDRPSEHLLRDVIESIDAAAADKRITSLVLVLHEFSGTGSSKILELGNALRDFRNSGKKIYAVADLYTQQNYLLASFADQIYLNPFGGVELRGLGSFRSYYGDAFEKLKVKFHVFRTGEFKDAVEPYIAGEMSESSRAQTSLWLQDIWQVYRQTISQNRNIDPNFLDRYSNEFDQLLADSAGDSATTALKAGLIDGIYYRDEIRELLKNEIGANKEDDFYQYVNYQAYLRDVRSHKTDKGKAEVGLVVAAGTILDGSQAAGSIGGDSLAAQLRELRTTHELRALVLRVDSPGGSAFASDIIRRELALYKEAGIPIVVSMGSLAASGGYWISMPADEIWATATTLTGSIGVFGIVPTIEESIEAIGIRRDGIGTGPLANAFLLDMPMSDQVGQIIQLGVDHIYDEFLTLVSNSRDISVADLGEIAQGRVWTGNQALELGLVDHIGDLKDAEKSAATIAGVQDSYQLVEISPELSPFEQIAKLLMESVSGFMPIQGQSSLAAGLSSPLVAALGSYMKNLQLNAVELAILLNDPGHQYLFCGACQSGGSVPIP